MRVLVELLGHRLDLTIGPATDDSDDEGEHDNTAAHLDIAPPAADEHWYEDFGFRAMTIRTANPSINHDAKE